MSKKIKKLAETITRHAAATNDVYKNIDLGIRISDDETRNIISSTFGVIKNNLDAFWSSVGFEPNVNTAYHNTMTAPEKATEAEGKIYFPHPGVGNLKAYNEAGNPSGGVFTLSTLG